MSTKTVCDYCGMDVSVMGFEVERKGMVTRATDGAGPWDLCSAACLEAWAAGRRETTTYDGAGVSAKPAGKEG